MGGAAVAQGERRCGSAEPASQSQGCWPTVAVAHGPWALQDPIARALPTFGPAPARFARTMAAGRSALADGGFPLPAAQLMDASR